VYTPKSDLAEALKRGKKWLPDVKDKSNGWAMNHPFTKFMMYQRALYWSHLFPFVWPDARPSEHAKVASPPVPASCRGQPSTRAPHHHSPAGDGGGTGGGGGSG
jgi:hypothetical protein